MTINQNGGEKNCCRWGEQGEKKIKNKGMDLAALWEVSHSGAKYASIVESHIVLTTRLKVCFASDHPSLFRPGRTAGDALL